jgi:hypothetical protein
MVGSSAVGILDFWIFGLLEHFGETRFTAPKFTLFWHIEFVGALQNKPFLREGCAKNRRIRALTRVFQNSPIFQNLTRRLAAQGSWLKRGLRAQRERATNSQPLTADRRNNLFNLSKIGPQLPSCSVYGIYVHYLDVAAKNKSFFGHP